MRKSLFLLVILGSRGGCYRRTDDVALGSLASIGAGEVAGGSCSASACNMEPAKTETNQTDTFAGPCPSNMVLVEGEYCRDVKQVCKRYKKEDTGSPYARCEEFLPSKCLGKREHKRFCIERFEHTARGETLPMVSITYEEAKQVCINDGKRICKETDGEFAMEGEEMLPYSTGYIRPSGICNFDNTHLGTMSHMLDLRKTEEELAECKSPFGVISGPGNVDEWYERDRTPGMRRNTLKFGWWGCLRNRVRPATVEHDDTTYRAITVGTRCCKDPSP